MPYVKDPKANALCGKAMMRGATMLGAGFAAILLVGFLGLYHSTHPAKQPKSETLEDYHQSISEKLIGNFRGGEVKRFLRLLTSMPHPAGTLENAEVADTIARLWKGIGLEDVHFVEYEVLLSYPNYTVPNQMFVVGDDEEVVFASTGMSPVIIPEEQGAEGAGTQWVAYSANGAAEGELVYCHYGRAEDFERLSRIGISVEGKIAMMRYGEGFRGDKVRNAQLRGAIGAILFSDPKETARAGTSKRRVYPNTEWMPSEAVQRGSIMHGDGDPLSPLQPSKKDLYRTRTMRKAKEEGVLPSIPVLPLSYSDAWQILSRLDGRSAPFEWQGGINVTYRLGPKLKRNYRVRIEVQAIYDIRRIRNVIGYIYGSQNAERYVILGNHYDAWVYGSIDPNSGTAALTEVARSFMQTINETSWRPARTLMFCSWDAEEYGLIGSTEFVEEFANILNRRAVVYLNVDNIHSNQSLSATTVPMLYQVATETAKRIPNPMKSEAKLGRHTVYDTWIRTFPNEIPFRADAPRLRVPGAGSDHAPFLNYLGVPVIDFTYRNATTYDTYPLYHTLYETPFVNEHIFDTDDFAVHKAAGQYWAELARQFADSPVLPLNVTDLALSLTRVYVRELKRAMEPMRQYAEQSKEARLHLGFLIKNCVEFLQTSVRFEKSVHRAVYAFSLNPFDARRVASLNDRLMGVERCFIAPRGLPKRPEQRHLLFSISDHDNYASRVMAPLYDQIDVFMNAKGDKEREAASRGLAMRISAVQYAVQCANATLLQSI